MNHECINGIVSLEVPENFRTMSAGELQQVYLDENPKRWGTWNHEGHVMITVMWKDYPPVLPDLSDLKAVCRKNEQKNSRGYTGHGYRFGGFFSATVGESPAEGYRFSYRIGKIVQSAETVLVRRNRTLYSFTCAGRAENRSADHDTFSGILAGIRFS